MSIALSFEGLNFNLFSSILSSFETKPLFLRIVVFLILEVFISMVFVKLYLYLTQKSEGNNPLALVFKAVLLMCSAWTTLFNVKWLILIYFDQTGAWVMFLIMSTLIANLIWTYWYDYETKDDEMRKLNPVQIFFIHALFLGLVFSILMIDKSY